MMYSLSFMAFSVDCEHGTTKEEHLTQTAARGLHPDRRQEEVEAGQTDRAGWLWTDLSGYK